MKTARLLAAALAALVLLGAAPALAQSAPTGTSAPRPPTPSATDISTYEKEVAADYAWLFSERRVTLNFPQVPLLDVSLFLQDISDMNFVLDAEVVARNPPVTLRVKDISLTNAFGLIIAQAGCSSQVWRGTVFISEKKPAPKPHDIPLGASLTAALEKKASINFPSVALSEVAAFIAETAGADVQADAEVKDVLIALRLRRLPLASILAVICRQNGLELEKRGESTILIKKRAAKKPGK